MQGRPARGHGALREQPSWWRGGERGSRGCSHTISTRLDHTTPGLQEPALPLAGAVLTPGVPLPAAS